jgi:PKD repeat protein
VRTRFSVAPTGWGSPLVGEATWDFGDGSSARGNEVSHVYANVGTYEVRVSATAAGGVSATTRTITIGKPTLANVTRPVVAGVAHVGRALECKPGVWKGTEPIAYTFSWLRSGMSIAHGRRYRVRAADRGALLACRVKATNGPKTAVAVSRAVRVS